MILLIYLRYNNKKVHRIQIVILFIITALSLIGCEGILEGIYDEIPEGGSSDVVVKGDTVSGSLYVEAIEWDQWYYLDLHAIRDAVTASHRGEVLDSSCFHFSRYPVPMTLSGVWDGVSRIRTNRFWVLTGGGIRDFEFVSDVQSDVQPEPEHWDLAIHRDNNRTNGGAVLETPYETLEKLPAVRQILDQMQRSGLDTTFTPDALSDHEVWVDQSTILSELVPCQVIPINQVLSLWMTVDLPPIPPAFTHNSHVFLLRMSDGTVAALRCASYISAKNVKCCLTIEYKYPV